MGAGMFGFHSFPDDPDWKGWWGDEPPFRVPVFVLTHRKRDSIDMTGGTTFHFVDADSAARSSQQATAAAGTGRTCESGAASARCESS